MKFYIQPPITGHEIKDLMLHKHWEMYKWKYMWHLRHLENEILEQGGRFILETNKDMTPTLNTRDFTAELTEKIRKALEEMT